MVRLLLCILFIQVSACGKQKFPDYEPDILSSFEEQEEGYFSAQFQGLNFHRAGNVKAKSVLWIRGNQFYARIVMLRARGAVRYQQYIHKGSRCPDQRDDINGDNLIDMEEVIRASGELLIPLDRNLNSQRLGNEWFPKTDRKGMYYYTRAGAITEMMKDLRQDDPYPGRGNGKLSPGEDLAMDQRTIVIYGSSSDPLLPVACAKVVRDINN
jgi:hypothetical protein